MKGGMMLLENLKDVLDLSFSSAFVYGKEKKLIYANPIAHETFMSYFQSEKGQRELADCFDYPRLENKIERHCMLDDVPLLIQSKWLVLDDEEVRVDWVNLISQEDFMQHQLASVLEPLTCGLCILKIEEDSLSPVYYNETLLKLLGIVEDDSFAMLSKDLLQHLHNKVTKEVFTWTWQHQNPTTNEACWLQMDGSMKTIGESLYLYGVFTDVSEIKELSEALEETNERMQTIINAIDGGVAIYRLTNQFETLYFSDGVAELVGFTPEDFEKLTPKDAADWTYEEDRDWLIASLYQVLQNKSIGTFEFRQRHRSGDLVWVRMQAKWVGEEDGHAIMHCVFHNITDLKEAQIEMDHLVNSIPGGIASYIVDDGKFIPTFFSDGVMSLSGHTREEYDELVKEDAVNVIYEGDRERVLNAAIAAVTTGEVLDVSYRTRHKNGHLVWIHLNGQRMGPLQKQMRFYAVFTGLSAQSQAYQSIVDESDDGIYVIERDNFELLYVSDPKKVLAKNLECIGQPCYKALFSRDTPCTHCPLHQKEVEGKELDMVVEGSRRFYQTRYRKTDWNGLEAYIKVVRDVTDEMRTRKEKERLEQYFSTVVENLPGGISVVRLKEDNTLVAEYISNGFAELFNQPLDVIKQEVKKDLFYGFHSADRKRVEKQMREFLASDFDHAEIICRFVRGDQSEIWVKNTLSFINDDESMKRLYCVYHDVTAQMEEQNRIRRQYNDMILQHYRMPNPNDLIIGHSNITKKVVLDMMDMTSLQLLGNYDSNRDALITTLASYIVDLEKRQEFLSTFLSDGVLNAFHQGNVELRQTHFVHFPKEKKGRYVDVSISMVVDPETGDITGIFTMTDKTEKTISDRIMEKMTRVGYDFIADVDLNRDYFKILVRGGNRKLQPPDQGYHSVWVKEMSSTHIIPRDRATYLNAFQHDKILARLKAEGSYTVSYSMQDDSGEVLTKSMVISMIDEKLNRISFSRSDITDSVREQQGLLRATAVTFELSCFLDLESRHLTLYTRDIVLENLPPYLIEDYSDAILRFINSNGEVEDYDKVVENFQIETMLQRLKEKPEGYDFVFTYHNDDGEFVKQVNILWGDVNHHTICLVRADVTEMLNEERKTKRALENALKEAEEASRAKSDFLSTMSHDIRTPMNAIMGMTALAIAHLDDPNRVQDCLNKISYSSQHLLSLINDILDMSKIERSLIVLNHLRLDLNELLGHLESMMQPQARAKDLHFSFVVENLEHPILQGDSLRLNQILINLLSNAIKFTPNNGTVSFVCKEIGDANKEGYARFRFIVEDSGVGMTPEFMVHLFDPFTRSHRVSEIEGTGLGLSITKGLIDLMDGSIQVRSALDEGTTFIVELEFEKALYNDKTHQEIKNTPAEIQDDELFKGIHFLVAEDNAINAEILMELLEMMGATSTLCVDGAETVEVFDKSPLKTYDAILMDIQMPVMNGYEATRAIRQMARVDANLPIVAMTANAFAEDVQASKDAGMNAHVAKPVDLRILKSTLFDVLNKK